MTPVLRRLLVPVRDALRSHRHSTLIILTVLALTGAAVYPVGWLANAHEPLEASALAMPPIPGAGLEAPASLTTRAPHETQQLASDALYRFALGSALAILGLGLLTGLTLGGARTAQRAPEFAVRRAVGGSRRFLALSVTGEGLVIAAGTFLIAAPVALFTTRLISASWPGRWHASSAALPGLLATLVLGAAIASLVVPYLVAPRPRLSGEVARPLSLFLPIAQMGCSLIILLGGALMIRHARAQSNAAVAGAAGGTLVSLRSDAPAAQRSLQYQQFLARLQDSARIESASLGSHGLRLGLGTVEMVLTDCGDCAEFNIRTKLKSLVVTEHLASPDTFRALDVPVIAGRGFTLADNAQAPPVAVVTRSLAERGFQYGEAVGRDLRIRTGGATGDPDGEWFRVVGIVEDYAGIGYGVGQQPRMAVFLSVLQRPAEQTELLLRGPDAGPELRQAAEQGNFSIVHQQGETEVVLASLAPSHWFGRLFSALGWVMLAIGGIGSLVVMRAWLTTLIPELGLRAAVGASRKRLVGIVLGRLTLALVLATAFAAWVAPGVRVTLSRIVGADVGGTDSILLGYSALLATGALVGILAPLRRVLGSPPATLMEHTAE